MTWTVPISRGRTWTFDRAQVVGILNATPDSFSDGGALDAGTASERIHALLDDGANALDLGGESTRPGHLPVPVEEEWARVQPIIAAVRREAPEVILSIDTQKAEVAAKALAAGVDFVNDVSAMGDPGMAAVVREAGCAIVLMRHDSLVGNAVEACRAQWSNLVAAAGGAGIGTESIVLDPGLGFGDRPGPSVDDNMALLDACSRCDDIPVMIGHSRKRFVAALAQKAGADLDVQTAELSRRAVDAGAAMVRVHHVAQTVRALA